MSDKIEQIIKGKSVKKEYNIKELCEKLVPVYKYPFQNLELTDIKEENWLDYPNLKEIITLYNPNHYVGKKYHEIQELKISDLGRVKVKYKNNVYEILAQSDDIEYGYLRLPKFPGFGYVYRLVADTWVENTDKKKRNIVHHINNDGYNNEAKNLIWVTAEEHAKIHS